MRNLERRMISAITARRNRIVLVVASILGLWVRLSGFDFISGDLNYFLIPWYAEISKQGLASLSSQVGDYNLLYQTIIALMSYLDVDCVVGYKTLSVVFDYVLAVAAGLLVCEIADKKPGGGLFCVAYTIFLFLPTVVLNSAWWGQCDAIYTSVLVLMLWRLLKKKYLSAFLLLGVAFACKLQAIFILPFLICWYFYKKSFTIGWFAASIAVFWASGIVAFFCGRSLLAPFEIYLHQTNTYARMYMNFPSFWMILGGSYQQLKLYAIAFTLILCGLTLYLVLSGRYKPDSKEKALALAAHLVWTCLLFLPSMHDRYGYLLDILLVILAFVNKKYLKYAAVALFASLYAYGVYLFKIEAYTLWLAVLYLAAWGHMAYTLLEKVEKPRKNLSGN